MRPNWAKSSGLQSWSAWTISVPLRGRRTAPSSAANVTNQCGSCALSDVFSGCVMSQVIDFAASRTIRTALKEAQDALWATLPPGTSFSHVQAFYAIRAAVLAPEVAMAMSRATDPVPLKYLRQVRDIVSRPLRSRTLIDELWDCLDRPELNRALGQPLNSRMKISYGPREDTAPGPEPA
jgi:hypothetical protein